MTSRLKALLEAAKDTFQAEGLVPLLRRSFRYMRTPFIDCGKYYLYEKSHHTFDEANEANFTPTAQNVTFMVIASNKEADEVAATTGFDLRRRFASARKRLDKGAIAFCVLVDGEFVSISWVALTEEAKKAITSLPQKVDFSNGEAYIGDGETIPAYRGKHVIRSGPFERFQFLKGKGVVVSRCAVSAGNFSSRRLAARCGRRMYGEACYFRFLGWKFWRERTINSPSG